MSAEGSAVCPDPPPAPGAPALPAQRPNACAEEATDVLRQQAEALEAMADAVKAFPRRWARMELSTSQRKTLMLSIKARRKRAEDGGQPA
ncbi:unnamed protein product [Prorocentrum cordatum]|uniref:Uncharacterized protein n=1 Tax=Prorocentrum cordatum TaxID=2364126 RepID=A0ABN9T799_9DINO|nr:unnamed protein product [Polarella glacialis]